MVYKKRCAIVADFTASGLSPLLASGRPLSLDSVTAPYDNVELTLLDEDAKCWSSDPHVAVAWTRPEGVVKSFADYCGSDAAMTTLLREVDAYCEKLKQAAKRVQLLIVPSWVVPAFDRGVGALNLNITRGIGYALLRMNLRLIEQLSSCSNAIVLDASRWISLAGSDAQNPKYWYLGKIAFSPKTMQLAADEINAAAAAFFGVTRKTLILDLDDTLWGGVVGDVGWQGIDLGGHSPNGEAFVDFQKALKTLSSRGTILAICSKNTESIALQAIDQNPNMILKRDNFAAWRINWRDKAENIREIANDLNLGLNSMVFIDDNPVERERVRTALPEVLVPDWPKSKMLYAKALKELTCFDQAYANAEDAARTRMYVAERKRKDSANQGQSVEEYLHSLKLVVEPEPINESNLKRVAQLLNKTNQMNLRTRRLTEEEFSEWLSLPGTFGLAFRVTDRFGDYGITGIGTMAYSGTNAFIEDFVLSCRVMGRGVEKAMLSTLVKFANAQRFETVRAIYRPTSRNMPCKSFFETDSKFKLDDEVFIWNAGIPYDKPNFIENKYNNVDDSQT